MALRCKANLTSRSCQANLTSLKNSIRDLRARRSLSQAELAKAMQVSRQTINAIETERYTPSLPLALALARYFETTVEEMFDDDGA